MALMKKDLFGAWWVNQYIHQSINKFSDPYVFIALKSADDQPIDQMQTRSVKKTLDPVWNESVQIRARSDDKILLQVWGENRIVRFLLGILKFYISCRPETTSSVKSY